MAPATMQERHGLPTGRSEGSAGRYLPGLVNQQLGRAPHGPEGITPPTVKPGCQAILWNVNWPWRNWAGERERSS